MQLTRIDTAELNISEILEAVQSRAEEMDTLAVRWAGCPKHGCAVVCGGTEACGEHLHGRTGGGVCGECEAPLQSAHTLLPPTASLRPPMRRPPHPARAPQKLKGAGFGSQKLESGWQAALGKEAGAVGEVQFVPRQVRQPARLPALPCLPAGCLPALLRWLAAAAGRALSSTHAPRCSATCCPAGVARCS